MKLKSSPVWDGLFLSILMVFGLYMLYYIKEVTDNSVQTPIMSPLDEFIITSQGDTAWVHYDTVVYKSYRIK